MSSDAQKAKRRPNFVWAWRKERRLTQEKLAERAGISTSMVSLIENGGSGFTIDTLVDIATALEVKPGWLLDRDPRDPENVWNIAEEITRLPAIARRRVLDAAKVLVGT